MKIAGITAIDPPCTNAPVPTGNAPGTPGSVPAAPPSLAAGVGASGIGAGGIGPNALAHAGTIVDLGAGAPGNMV